ncbi:hypothetical protein JTE90_018231 [Oedothorax gibbosus]|uniref:DUF5641 domain-containing protein n=1 Tax=Oedothorax gibbosus TaxID=931172 RepID=A0AAV6U9V2_9ARAC|nr:hypothetical protein JTE90_018231 [Oedothorax gibbosus]
MKASLYLSPNLFFQDLKTSGLSDIVEVDHQSLNKWLIYRRNLRSDLRKRFRSEYLGALIQRSERKRTSNVSVGDVVLIGSDLTSTGQLLRSIQRLLSLPPGDHF